MIDLCLAYLLSAIVVATLPETAVLAFGPVALLVVALAIDARSAGEPRRRPAPATASAR
jgi:hypothetical protein